MITGRALTGYEPQAIRYFAAQIAAAPAPVTLIDCGADIGVFTRLVLSKTVNVDRIIAYEPNPTSFTLLEQNLLIMEGAERFSLIARAAAVSAVPGRAHLDIDTRYDNAHGAFITATPSGEPYHESIPVEVETIDQLEISPDSPVALKIDIEGEEINALKGAARVLRECPYFVVQFEAHPQVAERTKTDPSECLAYLEGMGAEESCAFCERTGDIVSGLTADRPFFSQVDAAEIYDVVAVHAAGLRR